MKKSSQSKSPDKISIWTFVKSNRERIDTLVSNICAQQVTLSDKDRVRWIRDEECLYNWARSEGVGI